MSRVIPAYLPVAAGFVFVGTWMLTPSPRPVPAAAAVATESGIAFPEARGKPPPVPDSWQAEKPEDLSPGIGRDPGPAPRRRSAAVASSVYYAGCNAVRAAGAAPLYRGDPGYRPEMDGDDDGIACEPYHRRY